MAVVNATPWSSTNPYTPVVAVTYNGQFTPACKPYQARRHSPLTPIGRTPAPLPPARWPATRRGWEGSDMKDEGGIMNAECTTRTVECRLSDIHHSSFIIHHFRAARRYPDRGSLLDRHSAGRPVGRGGDDPVGQAGAGGHREISTAPGPAAGRHYAMLRCEIWSTPPPGFRRTRPEGTRHAKGPKPPCLPVFCDRQCATEPTTWPTTGGTVGDGGLTWQDLGTVFVVDPLGIRRAASKRRLYASIQRPRRPRH